MQERIVHLFNYYLGRNKEGIRGINQVVITAINIAILILLYYPLYIAMVNPRLLSNMGTLIS